MSKNTAPTIVVVGGGTAGCVVAHHLAASPQLGDAQILVLEQGSTNSQHDNKNFMLSLDPSFGAVGQIPASVVENTSRNTFPYRVPQVLGGGSAVNGMVVSPLHLSDFDAWVTDYGCTGWNGDVIVRADTTWWPTHQLSTAEIGEVGNVLIDAGGSPATLSWNKSRVSGASLLAPHIASGRVQLLRDMATSICIDNGNVYSVRTQATELHADVVVLAAGAITTPCIAKASGIDHGRIGDGAQDHAAVFFTVPREKPAESEEFVATATWYYKDAQCIAYEMAHPFHPELGLVSLCMLRTDSRGHVAGEVPSPVLSLNLLHESSDRARMRDYVRYFVSNIAPYFISRFGNMWCDSQGTEVKWLAGLADDQLDDWLLQHVEPLNHIAGTCAMGGTDASPVTPRGQMRGVSGMYVADASVFPQLPRSNTNMVVAHVAAYITSCILEDLK